jgi:hypothetical protein
VKRKPFVSRRERRRSFLWLVIIVVIALILGALVAKIPSYVEKFYGYGDESYRPMDLDRDPDRDKSDHIYYKE